MKRIGYLYEKIYDIENIKNAIVFASRNKKKRKQVLNILSNLDSYAYKISELLRKESYVPNDYRVSTIKSENSKKERTIYKPKFYPDQIIQWAILLQIRPIFMRGMYRYSCGSVPGRGLYYAQKYIRNIVQHKFKASKYYLQFDIQKFYQSVNKEILMDMLSRKIKDKKLLQLIEHILSKNEALPIGTFLSQWLSNFYLEGFDHFIKEQLGVKYYTRYVDDGVLFWHNKKQLYLMQAKISNYLNSIGLTMKGDWKIDRTDNGLELLGFRFFRNKTIFKKHIMLKITRKVKRVYKRKTYHAHNCMGILSHLGQLKHTDSYGMYMKWIKPYINLPRMKNIVRNYTKERNKNGKIPRAGFTSSS